jgi:hypothetical protein
MGRGQHGGPPSALLARAIEQCEPRLDMAISRITLDFLGGIPQGRMTVSAEVIRPGRRIELAQAQLHIGGRLVAVAVAVAWRARIGRLPVRQDCPVDLDDVADELYSLRPEEFVAARTAHEKDAKTAGDRELAAQIHALRKPNAVGWLTNQLVRTHEDEIRPLIELGAALREATAALSGEQLRDLGAQQRRLVSALVAQARKIAHDADRPASDDVARGVGDTLHAALADESAAELLMQARLTDSLQRIGFAPTDDTQSWPTPSRAPSSGATHSRASAAKLAPEPARSELLARAERNEHQAQDAAQLTADELEHAQTAAEQAQSAVASAEQEVQRLRDEFERATRAHTAAEARHQKAKDGLARAESAAHDAMRRLEEASAQRQQLASAATAQL